MAKTLTGTVSSNKGDKTIIVTVAMRKTHPLYKKQYTFSKKFMAHDETNDAGVGDKVVISETRPLSARKRFKLDTILERAAIRHIEEEAPAEVPETVTVEKPKKPAVKKPKVEKPEAK
jgi:small subunit ribosomal protein S17